MKKLMYRENWRGWYRGINFEIIKRHDEDPRYTGWVTYLYINMEQVPEDLKELFWFSESGKLDIYNHPIFSEIGMNGINWYQKIYDPEKPVSRLIKVGSDHNHAWDHPELYDVHYMLTTIENGIDRLWHLAPGLLVWCSLIGGYYPADEGTFNPDGTFQSWKGEDRYANRK